MHRSISYPSPALINSLDSLFQAIFYNYTTLNGCFAYKNASEFLEATPALAPKMERPIIGCVVGIDALASHRPRYPKQ